MPARDLMPTVSHSHESILLSAVSLKLDNTILRGLALSPNGKFQQAEIDLSKHYSNDHGKFSSEGTNYHCTGHGFRLESTSNAVKLVGELGDGRVGNKHAEVDLSICIVVQKGKFVFVRQ